MARVVKNLIGEWWFEDSIIGGRAEVYGKKVKHKKSSPKLDESLVRELSADQAENLYQKITLRLHLQNEIDKIYGENLLNLLEDFTDEARNVFGTKKKNEKTKNKEFNAEECLQKLLALLRNLKTSIAINFSASELDYLMMVISDLLNKIKENKPELINFDINEMLNDYKDSIMQEKKQMLDKDEGKTFVQESVAISTFESNYREIYGKDIAKKIQEDQKQNVR